MSRRATTPFYALAVAVLGAGIVWAGLFTQHFAIMLGGLAVFGISLTVAGLLGLASSRRQD